MSAAWRAEASSSGAAARPVICVITALTGFAIAASGATIAPSGDGDGRRRWRGSRRWWRRRQCPNPRPAVVAAPVESQRSADTVPRPPRPAPEAIPFCLRGHDHPRDSGGERGSPAIRAGASGGVVAGDRPVERRGQRVDIGPRALPPARLILLEWRVARLQDDRQALAPIAQRQTSGTEVQQLHPLRCRDVDVVGTDVAVQHSDVVHVAEGVHHRHDDADGFVERRSCRPRAPGYSLNDMPGTYCITR